MSKERYELFGEFGIIHDTSPNAECMLLNRFQTCEILNRQYKENQQLKQQLAELREQIAICDEENGRTFMQSVNAIRENVELKQQLAEKEKEIEKINACVEFYKSYYISFKENVIEQLEKVKEFVSKQLFITIKDCSDLDEAEAKGCNELREETIEQIDNQIKQLKEVK